ncbi:MAG: hypothetical protein GY928_14055 [Colwellia sp.]|nr:hypothetical protein [Colwellia sp.]
MINIDLSNRPDARKALSLSIPFADYVYLQGLAKDKGVSINRLAKSAIQETLKRDVAGYETPEVM